MTQITGSQIGGVGRDGLFGIFNPQSDEGQVASGIFDADIKTFDPENRAAFEAADVVVGRSRVNTLGEADSSQESRGIDNTTIELSNGGGRVKGKGVVNGTVNLPDSLADSFGLIDSTVRGGAAANELQFEAISRGPGGTAARGAQSSTIEGGDSQDSISISALAGARGFGGATTVGSSGNDIIGGGGDDEIKISATSYALPRGRGDEVTFSRATGARGDSIIGGEGKNLISIEALAERGERANATGMRGGLINDPLNSETADDVADTVQISGTANARSPENAVGFASGASGGAFMIDGGSGTIDIRGTATARSNDNLGEATAAGLRDGGFLGGQNIFIMGEATGQQSATAYGAIDSSITSSGGDDQIVFKSKATANGAVEAYGMFDSRIDSGGGNDTITVLDESGYLDIGGNTIIDGGDGDDLISAGIGSGKILGGGGSGVDTLVADFFTTEGLEFEFIDGSQDILGLDGDGLRVTGSRTKTGESVAWTQEIFQIDQFQIGSELLSRDAVLARFSPTEEMAV